MLCTISAPNLPQRSSGNKAHPLRPIYLISKTPYAGVIHIPILSIHYLHPLIDFTRYNGIIVTSKQAALALEHYTFDWTRLKVICVGESTAQSMRELGAKQIDVADGYGMSIASILTKESGRWLYCRPKEIASAWPERVREEGVGIDEVILYETTCNDSLKIMEIEKEGVLIFTSPSAITCFLKHYDILPTHTVIAIGTTTQKALPSGVSSLLSEERSVESCVKKARELVNSSPF